MTDPKITREMQMNQLRDDFLELDPKSSRIITITEITARYALAIMQDAVENQKGLVSFPIAQLAQVFAELNTADSIDRKSMTGGI